VEQVRFHRRVKSFSPLPPSRPPPPFAGAGRDVTPFVPAASPNPENSFELLTHSYELAKVARGQKAIPTSSFWTLRVVPTKKSFPPPRAAFTALWLPPSFFLGRVRVDFRKSHLHLALSSGSEEALAEDNRVHAESQKCDGRRPGATVFEVLSGKGSSGEEARIAE